MFDTLKQDLSRKAVLCFGRSGFGPCLKLLGQRGTWAVIVYRFGRWANSFAVRPLGLPFKVLYFIMFYLVQMLTGISVQSYARIAPGFVIFNYSGIFLLAEEIGRNFTVYEGVTVGNIRGKPRLAIIGDNVTLEPGCKVLGDVTIGNDVVVRANSLVMTNVADNCIAMGNPARVTPASKTA